MNPDHFYNDTITIPITTLNDFGEKIEGATAEFPARFVESDMVIKDREGKETQADGLVHVNGDVTITSDTTIIFDGKSYDVMRIKKAKDGDGNIRHQKLTVKQHYGS